MALRIIDAQIHCWRRLSEPHWIASSGRGVGRPFLMEEILASMDAVGVGGAVLSPGMA